MAHVESDLKDHVYGWVSAGLGAVFFLLIAGGTIGLVQFIFSVFGL